ncbi:phosphoenolpyruvate--protein phosphotransferase, partial [Aduncisulcus paluster]
DLYDYMHPAVLALIENVIKRAREKNTWIGMCGNAAADPAMIEKLIEWGIDEISVSPSKVLECRQFVRSLA